MTKPKTGCPLYNPIMYQTSLSVSVADICEFSSFFPLTIVFQNYILSWRRVCFFPPKLFGGWRGALNPFEPPKPSCQIQPYFAVLKTNGELQVGEVMRKNWRNRRRNVACIVGKRSEFRLQQINTACSNALLGLAQGNIHRNTDISKHSYWMYSKLTVLCRCMMAVALICHYSV